MRWVRGSSFPRRDVGCAAVRSLDLNPRVRGGRRHSGAVGTERCAARASRVGARELRDARELKVKRPSRAVVEHERFVLVHIGQPSFLWRVELPGRHVRIRVRRGYLRGPDSDLSGLTSPRVGR